MSRTKSLRRSAFDLNHVKSVSVFVLLHGGEYAGRIVANWSDNPAGSVCTATVHVWKGPLGELPSSTGTAGGCGYCKLSTAIGDALLRAEYPLSPRNYLSSSDDPQKKQSPGCMMGVGESAVVGYFSAFGYACHRVV